LNSPLMVDSFSDILTRCKWYFQYFFVFFSFSLLSELLLISWGLWFDFNLILPTWGNDTTLPVISSLPEIAPTQPTTIHYPNRPGFIRCH